MYLPPHFTTKDRAHATALMRSHPFASLVSVDDAGFPFVSHIPLHLQPQQQQNGDAPNDGPLTLLGHVAKPNPHWKYLQQRPQALVTFMGPHAYLSPRVYPDVARVPSWNYLAVHCKVEARLIEDPLEKDQLLKKLISDHEPSYAAQWVALGTEFQHKMLAGIVGFELQVVDVQCKIKINQHRPEARQKMREIYAAGNEAERGLAVWMDKIATQNSTHSDASSR
jgi:transcriptional regulator